MTPAPTIAFSTLGCRLNQVDTRQLQAQLEDRGFRTVPFGTRADVVVVNTCTVTARAEFSDRQAVRRARRTSPDARVVVTGCWAQTNPADVAGLGGVDLVVGNADKPRLPDLVATLLTTDRGAPRIEVGDIASARLDPVQGLRPHRRSLARLRQDPGRLPAPVRLLHRAARARRQPQSDRGGDRGAGATARGGRPSGDRAHRRGPRPLGRRPHAALEPGRACSSGSSRCPGCAG